MPAGLTHVAGDVHPHPRALPVGPHGLGVRRAMLIVEIGVPYLVAHRAEPTVSARRAPRGRLRGIVIHPPVRWARLDDVSSAHRVWQKSRAEGTHWRPIIPCNFMFRASGVAANFCRDAGSGLRAPGSRRFAPLESARTIANKLNIL